MHTTKDLAGLLLLMQTSKQSGDLLVESQVQNEPPWQGQIRLVDGLVTRCEVRRKMDGRVLLRDNEAMRWLIHPNQGKMEWSLQEAASLPDTLLPLLPTNDDGDRGGQNNGKRENPYPVVEDATNIRNTYNAYNTYNTHSPLQDNVYAPQSYSNSQNEQPGLGEIPKRTGREKKGPGIVLSSRDLRQVFALIDGYRTIEEISRLLHKPTEFVIRIVYELQTIGLVE